MKPKILFVEDEIEVVQAYKPILENEGFEVITITNQYEAEQMIRNHADVKFVIADLMILKNRSSVRKDVEFGLNLIKTIKENRPNLPIIVFSANRRKCAEELGKLGVSFFIEKGPTEAIDKLKSYAHYIMENSADFNTAPIRPTEDAEKLRKIVAHKLNEEFRAKESILSISEEGDFNLIKHLVGFKKDIEKQIEKFPYSKNVFLMMKFRDSNKDLSDFIIDTLLHHGLQGIRADQEDWNITKDIFNPIAVLYCCKYGIALFDEPEEKQTFSANVAYELGMMHSQNKECLILRHNSLPVMPFDLLKDLYENYDRELAVGHIIKRWIKQISS